MSKVQGVVKWFSNKKGFGFITPGEGSPTTEDIFVHQSSISSEGYRTLDEGWEVEFTIGHDEGNRLKAESVMGIGGGPCTGPSRSRNRRRKGKTGETSEDAATGGRARGTKGGPRDPFWHDTLNQDVKDAMVSKNISCTTGTVDVALGENRVKLGTGGYASLAGAKGVLAEGKFTCDAEGKADVSFEKVISFVDEDWKLASAEELNLPSTFLLIDDAVECVKAGETPLTLWGDVPSDPRAALESNEFLMRRVVLQPKARR